MSLLEEAGFEVRDVESLREHYALTLREWVANAGEVPQNVAKICQLTWACTKKDPHPNAEGHKVIAGAFAAVLAKNDAPGAGAPPAPSESATPEPGKDTGANAPTTNGDLAETGASSSAPVLAGAGLAVVVVGTAAVYFARRRRTGEEG